MDFKEFKEQFFNGDEEKAVAQLAYESYNDDFKLTGDREHLQVIVDSMEEATANKYMDFLGAEIENNPQKFEKILDFGILLQKIKMDVTEVANSKRNPFVKKFWIGIITTFAGIIIMAFLLLSKRTIGFDSKVYDSILYYGTALFISVRSVSVGGALTNIFRFKKAKKYILENPDAIIESDESYIEDKEAKKQENLTELTRAYCLNELIFFSKNRKNIYLMLAIISVPAFVACSLVSSMLWLIPAIICPILFMVMFFKNKKNISITYNMDFHIEVATCERKTFSIDTETNQITERKIYFSNGKNYKIDFSYKGIYLQEMLSESLYNSIEEGDICYTVHIGNSNKISLIFPTKEYTLSREEFTKQNDSYYPLKNSSVDIILENDIKQQYEKLSSIQQNAITKAEKEVETALKKRNKYLVYTGIVIMLTFIGIFLDIVQLFNIFIQLFLFIIPVISPLKAIVKAKDAVDDVKTDYVGYYHLRNRQNAGAMVVLLLVANSIAYLVNLILFMTLRT